MTQGILYVLLHLAECGIAVDGTIRLHADAAELIGKRKVFVQLCFAELCQFFQCHAVTFQLPQNEPMKPSPAPVVSTARTFRQGAKPWVVRV